MQIFAVILTFVAAALPQRISIGAPASGDTITAGQDALVSIIKGDTLSASTEIGIAILLHHCTQNPCEDASQTLGSVLYVGPFKPQRDTGFGGQPLQNFTVPVPDSFPSGSAVLSVAHANLIGAGPSLFTEIPTATVNVN